MCGGVKWLVLWSLWAARVVRQPTAAVRVGGGWLRGSVAHSGTHAHYLGIPYATLQQRFQAPGPEPIWDGVFEAIDETVRCTQAVVLESKYSIGEENCMKLNVYTPLNIPDETKLPVMVFIHGGGFFEGSSSRMIYGPEYLTRKGIILVTINYRLNVQGFLCLGIKEAPGNAGLKDQVAALRWVKRNIRAFSGDPDNVTIFGESAGASSVSYHMLSPMSKGLFHKAIVQSGSSLAGWAFQYKPVYIASLLAKAMGLDSNDPKELYEFFIKQTDSDLVTKRVPRQENNIIITEILFAPCAEKSFQGQESFLTELPYELLSTGNYNKVPLIIGANTEEGITLIGLEEDNLVEKVKFERALPKDLVFLSNETKQAVANKLKEFYMGSDEVSKDTKVKLSKLYGEPYINYPVMEETDLMLKTNDKPIYHYLFGYDGRRNIVKKTQNLPLREMDGASHADELFYLFSQTLIPGFAEKVMIDKMTTMWTNFVKYGNPTPHTTENLPLLWPRVTTDNQLALKIDQEFSTIPLWHSDSLKYWREIYSKYRRKNISY